MVIVFVSMHVANFMMMDVCVLPAPEHPVNCPHQVNHAKSGKYPGRQATSDTFEQLKFSKGNPKSNADKTQYNAAANMPQPA